MVKSANSTACTEHDMISIGSTLTEHTMTQDLHYRKHNKHILAKYFTYSMLISYCQSENVPVS